MLRSASASAIAWNNWLRFDVTGEYRAETRSSRRRQLHRILTGRPLLRRLRRRSLGVGGPGQRLYRSRHLVVHHAVHRRRRRLAPTRDHRAASRDVGFIADGPARRLRLRRDDHVEVELRLGAACRPRLRRSPTTSRSSSPIATSTWATAQTGDIDCAASTAAQRQRPARLLHLDGHRLARHQARRALDAAARAASTHRRR